MRAQTQPAPVMEKDALLKKLRAVKQRLDAGDYTAVAEAERLVKEASNHE